MKYWLGLAAILAGVSGAAAQPANTTAQSCLSVLSPTPVADNQFVARRCDPSGNAYVNVLTNATGGAVQATASASINVATATTTQLVALVAGQSIYVTGFDVIAGGTGNITFEYGTGTACATGTTVLTGAYSLVAQAGLARGGAGVVWKIPAGNALCILTSAAVQMSGSISYTQF